MAESSSAPVSARTACDRCHSRKIRCDRLYPCKNCVSANTVCGRLRRKTGPRKTNPTERIRLLTERMHQLENIVHDFSGLSEDIPDVPTIPRQKSRRSNRRDDASGVTETDGSIQRPSDISDDFMHDVGIQATQTSTSPTSGQAISTHTKSTNAPEGTRALPPSTTERVAATHTNIPFSIGESSFSVSMVQRVTVTKILAMLDEFSRAPSLQDWSVGSRDDACVDKSLYHLTPSDIINVLATPHTPVSSFHWSNSTLATSRLTETIGMELLDGKVINETKTLPYKIILNFQAAMLLGRQKGLSHGLQEHIETIKRRKFLDVLSKLDLITFRTPPSLHMLRAQCMGVVILQLFGNVPEAWSMMVAASRTFVALGYDTIQNDNQLSGGPDEDREACIAWCYQLDRSMSLLLHRPPLLPRSSMPPQVSSSLLDNEIMWKLRFDQLNLDLAHIQGMISFVTTAAAKETDWKNLEPLHDELHVIWKRLDTWENNSPGAVSDVFVRDVSFLRFRGYATQTMLLQLPTDLAKSSLLQRVAVDCARKCFESLQGLTKEEHKNELIDLSWDILLYSLSPLCVLGYKIVRARDSEDLKLLEDFARFIFTRIIKDSPDTNPLATRVYNLYRSIIVTCRPLISSAPTTTTTTAGQPTYPTNHTPHRKNFMNFEHFFGGDGSATGSSSTNTSIETNQNPTQNGNAIVGGGAQIDDGVEDASVAEEHFMKLLTYRVNIGWSD